MGRQRPAPSPSPNHLLRALLPHRAARATAARPSAGIDPGRRPSSAARTLAAYRAERAIQPW